MTPRCEFRAWPLSGSDAVRCAGHGFDDEAFRDEPQASDSIATDHASPTAFSNLRQLHTLATLEAQIARLLKIYDSLCEASANLWLRSATVTHFERPGEKRGPQKSLNTIPRPNRERILSRAESAEVCNSRKFDFGPSVLAVAF